MIFVEFWKNYQHGILILESRKHRYREQYLKKGICPDDEKLQALIETLVSLNNDEMAKYLIKKFHEHEAQYVNKHTPSHLDSLMASYRDYVRGQFLHYSGLNIPSINNYRFEPSKSLKTVLNDFERLERLWKEENTASKQWIDMTEELRENAIEIVTRFPDGFMWVMLDRATCSAEGEAMGHCGNAGGDSSGRILSLRKLKTVKGKTYGRPSLTFIMDENHVLGEMKGRGNEKPAEKYHPYIIALLKERVRTSSRHEEETEWFIRDIRGGGWLPQNNFSLADLSQKDSDELYKVREDLFGFDVMIDKAGGLNEDVYIKILTAFPDQFAEGMEITATKIRFTINNETPHILSLMHRIPDKVDNYLEKEPDFFDWVSGYRIDAKDGEGVYDTIIRKKPEIMECLKSKILERKDEVLEYLDIGEDENDAVLSELKTDNIFNILWELDDDFQMALRSAYFVGAMIGIESAYHEHYRDQICGLEFISSEDPIPLSIDEYGFNKTVLSVSTKNAKKLLKYSSLSKYIRTIDETVDEEDVKEMRDNYYWEPNEDSMVERFVDEYC